MSLNSRKQDLFKEGIVYLHLIIKYCLSPRAMDIFFEILSSEAYLWLRNPNNEVDDGCRETKCQMLILMSVLKSR